MVDIMNLTEEQNKKIGKLQTKYLLSVLWSSIKTALILFVMNFAILLVDKFYVHSFAFMIVMVIMNVFLLFDYMNKGIKKRFEDLQTEVLKIIKE